MNRMVHSNSLFSSNPIYTYEVIGNYFPQTLRNLLINRENLFLKTILHNKKKFLDLLEVVGRQRVQGQHFGK